MSRKHGLKRLVTTFSLAAVLSGESVPLVQAQTVSPAQLPQITQMTAVDGGHNIVFDAYENLPASWQKLLETSKQIRGFSGTQGKDLYDRLDAQRRAAFLNFCAKAEAALLPDQSTVLSHIREIEVLEKNKFIATVDAELGNLLEKSKEGPVFFRVMPVANVLHRAAAPDFRKVASYKTRDKRGNLEVTLSNKGDQWKAEVDIDEALPGMRHFFGEVVPHMITRGSADPYKIKPLLEKQSIDTRYTIIKLPKL